MPAFEWDKAKEKANIAKHGVSFRDAERAFDDPYHLTIEDLKHSEFESRQVCLGKVDGGVMTVRFTYRGHKIRIIGAAYWRKGRKAYEEKWKA